MVLDPAGNVIATLEHVYSCTADGTRPCWITNYYAVKLCADDGTRLSSFGNESKALAVDRRGDVVFTEIGYTTRPDPAVRPWEWPDAMKSVRVDQAAQATAYRALIAPFLDEPWFAGFFAWRFYADPDDLSQEAEWGFSPRGKLAEIALRSAFAARWAADGSSALGESFAHDEPVGVGRY